MRAPQYSSDPSEILSAGVIENPDAFYARVLSECPVSRIGETGVHLVASWAKILEVLGREEDFSANLTGVLIRGAQGQPSTFDLPPTEGTKVIATADEPRHSVHRRLVKPGLSNEQIGSLEPRIRRWTRDALSSWLLSGAGDFVPTAEILPAKVVGHLLGLPEGDAEQHRAWAMMGGEILAGDVSGPGLQNLARETAGIAEYLGEHIRLALSGGGGPPEGSLLWRLALGVGEGEVSLSEATGIAIVMFGAGGESTSALIGSSVKLLAESASLVRRLRESPELIPRFVEEAVRLEPPFKFHYRAVRRKCELDGYALAPGDRLMLHWAAANRDPSIYAGPNEIQLDRKYPKHHLSFGRGAHFCVGEQIARLEGRIMIEELLRCPGEFALDSGDPPVYARSIFVRRLERLPIAVE
ncbi:MAG TPA: cytochrome P450 [Myxococcales bacterium]|nr:cytochrome P450 [Myxococcales bacterium]